MAKLAKPIAASDYFLNVCNAAVSSTIINKNICDNLFTLFNLAEFKNLVHTNFRRLDTTQKQLLLKAQKTLQPFFQTIPVKGGPQFLRENYLSAYWFSMGSRVIAGVSTSADKAAQASSPIFGNSANPPFSTDAFVQQIGAESTNQKSQIISARDQLEIQKVGWYTEEQEADDIAEQLLASVGLRPESLDDMLFSVLKWQQGQTGSTEFAPGILNYDQCNAAYKAGFVSSQFKPMYIQIGKYKEDRHHSLCYRIFNLFRMRRTEHFVLGQQKLNLMNPLEYQKLVAQIHGRTIFAPKKISPTAVERFDTLLRH